MSRTDTKNRTVFTLPHPNQATLTFSSNLTNITVNVPKGSRWCMPYHWHTDNTLGCVSVGCLSGTLHVYRSNARASGDIHPGLGRSVVFKPGEVVLWCSSKRSGKLGKQICTEDWSAELVVVGQNLYRNVSITSHPCHNLDVDKFNRLVALSWTEISIHNCQAHRIGSSSSFICYGCCRENAKLLYHFYYGKPDILQRRVAAYHAYQTSRVQLQITMHSHGFHVYHGHINVVWPWVLQVAGGERPPPWAITLQLRIRNLISLVVMGSCYWVGYLILGMKGQYPEYTPPPRARVDRQTEQDEKKTNRNLA